MMFCRQCLRAAAACAALGWIFVSSAVFADDDPGYKNSALTGDWGGVRTSLLNKGIGADIVYKFDVMSNTTGGARTGTETLDNLDIKLSLDGEKLFGSKGTTALIYFLNNNGSQPGSRLENDAEGVDNIQVRTPGAKLYEAWVQQNFMNDRFSVLAGLYDLNSEFYVTDSSGLFLRPTFGIGTDLGQSGENGPSIFPVTSVGLRFKVLLNRDFCAQAVVLDGVAGDPAHPKGTHIRVDRSDGALIVGEADYLPGGESPKGKIGVGAWEYTKKFDDLADVDSSGNPIKRRSEGLYVLAERRIYQEPGHDNQGLTTFIRFGMASGDVNQFDYAWSAGAVYTGPFPGRDQGRLGLGVEGAHNSGSYRKAVNPSDASETAFELTYSDNLLPWLAVQPDVQYIINPGTDPALDNAVTVGARFTAKF